MAATGHWARGNDTDVDGTRRFWTSLSIRVPLKILMLSRFRLQERWGKPGRYKEVP